MLPADDDKGRPSPMRIGIWIVVSAVGLYFVVSGVAGALSAGG